MRKEYQKKYQQLDQAIAVDYTFLPPEGENIYPGLLGGNYGSEFDPISAGITNFNEFSKEEWVDYGYQNNFNTVDKTSAPIATASLREELSKYLTPIEIEINGSSFKVIDDREGHIPLVINSRVERAISFFQNRARDSFERWLTRYPYYLSLIHI